MWKVSKKKSINTEIRVGLFLVGQFYNTGQDKTGLFTSFSADQVNLVKVHTRRFLFFT